MTDNGNVLADPPVAGNEIDTLLGALERNRATFAWKCGDLDAAGLQARLAPSTMSLGGLVKHLAEVEDDMFSRRLLGEEPAEPWNTVDWDANPDWAWTSAADDTPEQVYAIWQQAVDRSRAAVDKTLKNGDLDQLTPWSNSRGESPNLRRILVDMIEEYARHTGHADLIRESVDGLTGEDRPR